MASNLRVSSGVTSSGIVLQNNSMTVLDGGTASSTTVNYGGVMNVSSGGMANITTVTYSGKLNGYGTANNTTLKDGGVMFVRSGGIANNTGVEYGCLMSIGSGGTANSVMISSGGSLYISRGVLNGATVTNGCLEVAAGGTVNSATVTNGLLMISSGAANGIVMSGGSLYVSRAGLAENVVATDTWLNLSSGAKVANVTLNQNASMSLRNSAYSSDTTVNRGAVVYCWPSGYLQGKLSIAGRVQDAGAATVSSVSEYEFIVQQKTSIPYLAFYEGGIAANATITVDTTNAWGDSILIDGAAANYNSAIITVRNGVQTETVSLNGPEISLADGKRVSVSTSGTQLKLSVTGTDLIAPDTPGNVKCTLVDNILTLSWTEVKDFSGVTYEIEYAASPDFSDAKSLFTDSTEKELALPKGEWFWHLRSVDGAGNQSPWTSAEKSTVDYSVSASGQYYSTITANSDVTLEQGTSVKASYPGAVRVTGNGFTVNLEGNNTLSVSSIRNAGILFGDDAYWADYYDYGPHLDGTVNFNGTNISFFSSVSNCITAAGIVGNDLTVNFNGTASGARDITFESTNPSSGSGNYAGGIIADGDLVINGTFGGDVNSHFDFSSVSSKRYGTIYGFYAGGNLSVNGDISGNLFQSAVSTSGSYSYGLVADGDLSVTGVLSGVIASTAENYAYGIRGSKVNMTVSGIVFTGKSSAQNDMTTLIGKLKNWESGKSELLGLTGQNFYAVYAGGNSNISFIGNALVVGNIFLQSDSVLTVSDAAQVYGDISSYYSGNTVVLKLSSESLNGTRITTSSWNSSIRLSVDAGSISENGSYALVEADGLSGQTSLKLSASGQETTLKVGQTAKIGETEYTLGLNNDLLSLTVSGSTPAPPATKAARGDRDGNGISDVLFVWTGEHRNGNFAHGYWMNGSADWWSANAPGVSPDWDNLGSYDMSGDGKADAVMFGNVIVNDARGAYIGYYQDGNDMDGWVTIGFLDNSENVAWQNKVGNLTGNASGKNSIVWYAPDLYALGAWTDGTTDWVSMSASFGGAEWTLAGCGDFDGDGKDSALMSYNGGQLFYIVDIDGTTAPLGGTDWRGWEIRAIGDFAGDGKDDIVLFHEETGSMVMCADGNIDSFVSIGQLAADDWFVVGAGDYNGDQKDDLLVRQYSTGMLGYYICADQSQWVEMGRGVGMEWIVIA